MTNIEQLFHHEIETERMWVASKQAGYIFFSILPMSIILVYLLWENAEHHLLVIWFLIITVINLLRWVSLHFYHYNKHAIEANVQQVKRVLIMGSVTAGCWWGVACFWFMEPSQPINVLIMGIFIMIVSMGAVVSWFCYFPAVIALIVPAVGSLSLLLFLGGDNTYMILGLVYTILIGIGLAHSVKLARLFDQSLIVNFENVALRRESEEKSLLLETALENMGQGISMSDQEDHLRMWNREFSDLLDSGGVKVSANGTLATLLNDAKPPIHLGEDSEVNHYLDDGRVYKIHESSLDHGGRVLTYTDITDLINREQAIEKARKSAEQANAAKTRFLAAASHDLRQPIHALGLFFAELSERAYNPETAKVIGQVEDSIAVINSMLNALLDVSKLDAEVVKPVFETFALNDLLTRLKLEFQPIALEKHNRLLIRPTSKYVHSDPAMLERMLRNLISNALRYTENGRILVAARRRGKNLICQVFDTGIGIPNDQLDEIFIEFHQLQNPARDRHQGLGLGLAIIRRLAKLLGHEIKVASQLGHGSCFTIILPLAIESPTLQPPKQENTFQLPLNPLTGCRVLVLDDDIAVLDSMQGLLTRWGCQVISACSQADAMAKLATLNIDLLIIDYRLPNHVSGIEVARELQYQLAYSFPVLIITGDTGPERLREAEASGFPLLHKPVEPAKLRSTLHYLVTKLKEDSA